MKNFLEDTIRQAGGLSLEYRKRLSNLQINRKSAKDLVTEADVAVEELICERIKRVFPSHSILGEESGKTEGDENCWIIDPIDGTTSFVHHQPFYSVSIALQKAGETILGAVYAPVLDELFIAEKGGAAELNRQKIAVSDCCELPESVLATGFACLRADHKDNSLPIFNKLMPIIRSVRRFGSAAVDLCYVACGRLDGFWEMNLNIYDIAAGKLILEQAGGVCTDFSASPDKLCEEVLAANPDIHSKMSQIITELRNKNTTQPD